LDHFLVFVLLDLLTPQSFIPHLVDQLLQLSNLVILRRFICGFIVELLNDGSEFLLFVVDEELVALEELHFLSLDCSMELLVQVGNHIP